MTFFQAHTTGEARSLLPANDRPVVILPVYNSYTDVVQCYQAYFRHTPVDVPLLVVDDGGWDRRTVEVLERVFATQPPAHDVVLLRQPANKGFVLTMNDAFAAAGRADVVILNSDVLVGPEWLDRLHAAAYSSSTIGTVSAVTNHGTIVSIAEGKVSSDTVPGGLPVDEAARRVAAGSAQLRPRIPTAVGHCTYVKRAMFDVVGYFDPVFSPGYGEEVDLSQRAVACGFEHIAADDVFVFHRGGSSFGRSPETRERQADHERIVQKRYPYYQSWVSRAHYDEQSPLAASLLAARRSLTGLRVGVDGLILGPLQAGSQINIMETVRALANRPEIAQLTLFTPPVIPDYVADVVRDLPKVTTLPVASLDLTPRAKLDVVYRPYQLQQATQLEWLHSVAQRVIVSWLDFIAYGDAAYFGTDAEWLAYRELAALAAFTVDGLTYISEHSRSAAKDNALLPGSVSHAVAYCGTDHTPDRRVPAVAPAGLEHFPAGFILCLGVSYLHKNRLLALQTLAELDARGWTGGLVLAGATPPHGSSLALESEFLLQHPHLADRVYALGSFSEEGKTWLYENSGLVLYPTVSEGFGLVPFEAAHYGVACLSTRGGSLDEVLGPDVLTVDSYDARAVADQCLRLLTDPAASQDLVDRLLKRSRDFTWSDTASAIISIMLEVTGRPATRVVGIRGEDRSHVLAAAGQPPQVPPTGPQSFEAAVTYFVDRPRLRRTLVPPGSKRQQVARSVINRTRSAMIRVRG